METTEVVERHQRRNGFKNRIPGKPTETGKKDMSIAELGSHLAILQQNGRDLSMTEVMSYINELQRASAAQRPECGT
jgi:hypothetical protein